MCSEATTKFFSYVDTIQQITFSKDGTRMYFLAAPEKHPVGLYCVPIDVERTGGTSMVGVVCCLFVTALFICCYLSVSSTMSSFILFITNGWYCLLLIDMTLLYFYSFYNFLLLFHICTVKELNILVILLNFCPGLLDFSKCYAILV